MENVHFTEAQLNTMRKKGYADPVKWRAYLDRQKEYRKEYMRKRRSENPDCHKIEYHNNKDKHRNRKLMYEYGISLEDYDEMFEKQNGLCAICKQPETCKSSGGGVKRLAVDHNHESGKVRSLLCTACNQGLGQFKDNISYLSNAITYLNVHHMVGG
ncbi:endonuclease VII domain-containing protein [Enterobacter hormaechei]